MPINFSILTLFPEMFPGTLAIPLWASVERIMELSNYPDKRVCKDKHKTVDENHTEAVLC